MTNIFHKSYSRSLMRAREGVPVYRLSDYANEGITGIFYESELQPVIADKNKYYRINQILQERKVKGRKQYYVSYQGWPEKFNYWVNANAVKDLLNKKKTSNIVQRKGRSTKTKT